MITPSGFDCQQCRVSVEVDGEVVGSCLCSTYWNGKAKAMVVDDVLVYEKYRGKGHGRKLMEDVLEFAKAQNVDSVELTVNEDNVAARGLYRKMGFTETSKKHCRRILNEL